MKTALYVAWRLQAELHQGWGPVGRLEHDDGIYRFYYTRGARTLEGFKPFTEMASFDEVYESNELFPLFANRLLGKQRPEYERFVRWGGFASFGCVRNLWLRSPSTRNSSSNTKRSCLNGLQQ